MGLWETFAIANLPHVKEALGISGPGDVDMDMIGKISQSYWEAIACPYRVTQHSEAVHEAEIEVCPYFENMKEILGEERARSMTLKCEAAVSVNYYDAILKALGVFDRTRSLWTSSPAAGTTPAAYASSCASSACRRK